MKITAETTLNDLAIQKTLLGVRSAHADRAHWNGMHKPLTWRVALNAPDTGMTFGYGVELHEAFNEAFEILRRTIGTPHDEHDDYDRATGDLGRPVSPSSYKGSK